MTTFLDGIAIAATAAGLIALGAAWANGRRTALDHGRADIQQFTESATALIEDSKIPQSVAKFVASLSEEVGHPRLAKWTAGEILSGRLFRPPQSPRNPEARRFREDLARLTASQQQALGQCFAYCLMSSAASDVLLGPYFRRIIYFSLFEPDTKRVTDAQKTRAMVVEFSEDAFKGASRRVALAEAA